MNLHILGAGRYDGRGLDELERDPDFRRATRNMGFAFLAARDALKSAPPGAALGLVVATSHGELEVTLSFLDELRRSGVARPLLFQNSLHNATLGFLARRFDIQGPALTVSDDHRSGENALETVELLLDAGDVDAVLAIGVDSIPRGHESLFHSLYPETPGEGAGAILFGRSGGASVRLDDAAAVPPRSGYYDSDFLECLALAWREGAREIVRGRPDQTASRTRLTWNA